MKKHRHKKSDVTRPRAPLVVGKKLRICISDHAGAGQPQRHRRRLYLLLSLQSIQRLQQLQTISK